MKEWKVEGFMVGSFFNIYVEFTKEMGENIYPD